MQAGRTFRVFVSSTFKDLSAERNTLHEAVFPRLRELCQKHGARFQAIDLRWGVGEEASLDQQAMNICLGEIERCRYVTPRPNFVVLLGQRYGWCPPPPQIPADEFRQILRHIPAPSDRRFLRKWYRRDKNAVPSECRLLPREPGGEYEANEAWHPVEARLHDILAAAAQEMDEERRRAYVASATEQEIAAGALRVPDPEGKVFCFFRNIDGATDKDGKLLDGADRFIDADQGPLDALKGALREKLEKRPEAVQHYTAHWNKKKQQPTPAHLEDLAEAVYRAVAGAIETELEHPTERPPAPVEGIHVEPEDSLEAEGLAHCDFANRLLRFFVGRTEALRQIREYLEGEERRVLAVVAEGGAGKSALMAKTVEEARMERGGAQIVYRFIGATPGSSDGRLLLRSLCQELSRRYGTDEETPDDYRELAPEFRRRLALATSDRQLIVILDALDQLSEAYGARGLTWLPDTLPDHVRLVVSTRRQAETFDNLERKSPRSLKLSPMSREYGEELVDLWLEDAHRTLRPTQREEVLDKFELSDGRPLYLKLAFEEARRWTSYDPQEMLEPTIPGIIRKNLLDRLVREERHEEMLVSRALGYLAASRYGLAEDELLDVLSRDPEVYGSFFRGLRYHLPPDLIDRAKEYRRGHETARVEADGTARPDDSAAAEQWLALLRSGKAKQAELDTFLLEVLPKPDGPRLPVVLWSRLYFDLEPYLTERLAEGSSLMAFYHREFDDVVTGAFLGDGRGCEGHRRLADYFRLRADPERGGRWEGGYPRGLSELPFHLARAGRLEELRETLTEFEFLYAKVAALGPQRLIADYDEARRMSHDEESMGLVQEALRLSAHVVGHDPTQLPGQLVGRLLSREEPGVTRLLRHAHDWEGGAWVRPLFATLEPAGGPLLLTVQGAGYISALTVTPDGRHAVSGHYDHTLKVCDLERGELLRTLEGHTDDVVAVAVTPDGRHAVSGSRDKTLKVWDLERGETLCTLEGHRERVTAVAVAPDGRRAVSGSEDKTLKVWDLERRRLLRTLRGHTDSVKAVVAMPDGRHAVSGSEDKTLKVWDLEGGKALRTLEGHRFSVDVVVVMPDGRRVVAADVHDLKIWDPELGAEILTVPGRLGHVREFYTVAVTPDGREAVLVLRGNLAVWDLEAEELHYLNATTMSSDMVLMPDGRRVVDGLGGSLGVWDLERLRARDDVERLRVCDLERAFQLPRRPEGHTGEVTSLAVTADGRHVLSGSGDETFKVWDLTRGAVVRTVDLQGCPPEDRDHKAYFPAFVTAVAVISDEYQAVVASTGGMDVWDLERGKALSTLEGLTRAVNAVAVTPDGRHAVSGYHDKTLKVWDLEGGEALRTLEGHTDWVRAVAVTPDGQHAISGGGGLTESEDNTLKVWDLERGELLQTLEGHTEPVRTVAVTPDGRHAVSGSEDMTLKVWDLELAEAEQTLEGHSAAVRAVAVTPDGRHAVSGSDDMTLKVWDLADGRMLATFSADSGVSACAAVPDDGTIVAGDKTGQVHFLRLEGIERPAEGVRRRGRFDWRWWRVRGS